MLARRHRLAASDLNMWIMWLFRSAHRLLGDHFVLCVDSDLNIVADADLRVGGHRPAVWIGLRYLGLASSFELRRHHFVVAAFLAELRDRLGEIFRARAAACSAFSTSPSSSRRR
jgi:hypothetical protein